MRQFMHINEIAGCSPASSTSSGSGASSNSTVNPESPGHIGSSQPIENAGGLLPQTQTTIHACAVTTPASASHPTSTAHRNCTERARALQPTPVRCPKCQPPQARSTRPPTRRRPAPRARTHRRAHTAPSPKQPLASTAAEPRDAPASHTTAPPTGYAPTARNPCSRTCGSAPAPQTHDHTDRTTEPRTRTPAAAPPPGRHDTARRASDSHAKRETAQNTESTVLAPPNLHISGREIFRAGVTLAGHVKNVPVVAAGTRSVREDRRDRAC